MNLFETRSACMPDKIWAAMSSPEVIAVSSLMRASAVESKDFPIKVRALDEKLKRSGLSTRERICLKAVMTRAGLLI